MKNENDDDDEDDDVDHEDADDDDDDDDGDDDDDVIYMMIRRVPKRCAFQSNAFKRVPRGGFQSEDCIRNCHLSKNSYIFFHAAWTTPRKHCKLKSHMALVDITNVKNIW
jgi:hypothetical protein